MSSAVRAPTAQGEGSQTAGNLRGVGPGTPRTPVHTHVLPETEQGRDEPSSIRVWVRDLHTLRFSHLMKVSSCSFFRFGGLPLLLPVFPGTFETFFCPSLSLRSSTLNRNVSGLAMRLLNRTKAAVTGTRQGDLTSSVIINKTWNQGNGSLPHEHLGWERICLQCRRPGFDPWVGKIPWRKERLPTPVFWPGEFHGLYSPWGHKESDMTKRLSLSGFPNSKGSSNLKCGEDGSTALGCCPRPLP